METVTARGFHWPVLRIRPSEPARALKAAQHKNREGPLPRDVIDFRRNNSLICTKLAKNEVRGSHLEATLAKNETTAPDEGPGVLKAPSSSHRSQSTVESSRAINELDSSSPQSWRTILAAFAAVVSWQAHGGQAADLSWSLDSFELPGSEPVAQITPSTGPCSTCIGVIDETLASCSSTRNCLSSFDDRPAFFYAPWEYEGALPEAMDSLVKAVDMLGGTIEEQQDRYLHVTFSEEGFIDDLEWLFSPSLVDNTVQVHAASRDLSREDRGRNFGHLERLRQELGWEQAPILRKLVILESPWDSFGPKPPPSLDCEDLY